MQIKKNGWKEEALILLTHNQVKIVVEKYVERRWMNLKIVSAASVRSLQGFFQTIYFGYFYYLFQIFLLFISDIFTIYLVYFSMA